MAFRARRFADAMPLTALELAREDSEEAWTRFRDLSSEARRALLDDLKAEIDRRVRTEPSSARPLAEALVRGAREAGDREALAHRARAVVGYFTGETAAAARDFERAAELYERDGDELDAARVRRSLVEVRLSLGQAEQALASSELARETFERLGEEGLLAQLEVNVGNVHFRQDDYPRARAHYEAARTRFEAIGDTLGGAFASFSLGNLEIAAYRLERAASWFECARASFAEAGQTAQVLDCDASLAWLDAARGRYDEATRGLLSLRERYAESKPSGVAYCDLDLASLYQRLDAWRDALQHARAAREAFGGMELEFERARAEAIEGLALLAVGQGDAAEPLLEQARAAFERLGNAAQRTGLDVQRAFLAAEDEAPDSTTIERLEAAVAQASRSGQALSEDLARLALARTHLRARAPREALAALGEAPAGLLPVAEDPHGSALDSIVLADAWRLAARAHRMLGDAPRERDALEHAVAVIESSFLHIPTEGVRIAFLRSRHDAFRDLAWARLEADSQDGPLAALSLMERGRSRSLARPGSIAGRDAPPEYREARERLDRLLSARLDAELGFAPSADGGIESPSLALLEETEHEVATLAKRFERDLGPARFDFEAEGGAAALGADEVGLAWLVHPEGARVLVVERGEVRAVELELPTGELALQRDRLALQLSKARLGAEYVARYGARIERASRRALARLGELLLAPALATLRTAPRALVLVPYGELRGLPFHALEVDGAPLADRFEVTTTPSLSLLAQRRRSSLGFPSAAGSVLLTGASEASLPAVQRELDELEALLGARAARRDEAQAFAALGTDPTLRALHVAAHGTFRAEHAAFSGLRLGERFLTAHDVRRLDLALDLVVLSGCESGRMLQVEGEESIGLPSAFLACGCATVVSSLWPVEDESTARFMASLYRALVAGDSPSLALHTARRTAREAGEPLWSWAAFELAGSPGS